MSIKFSEELLNKIYNLLSIDDLEEILKYLKENKNEINISDKSMSKKILLLDFEEKKELKRIVRYTLTQLYTFKQISKDKGEVFIRPKITPSNPKILLLLLLFILILIFYFLLNR